MTKYHSHYETIVQNLIDNIGQTIVLAISLGLGKPVGFVNALYARAKQDKSINLTIITGLTLGRPKYSNILEQRLIDPVIDRISNGYVDLLYEQDRLNNQLPDNIKIIEFFFNPAQYLHNNKAQQNYISSTYTLAVRDAFNLSLNVYAQQVASDDEAKLLSLSCNSDLFHAAKNGLDELAIQGKKIAIIAEINKNLPFMYGDAVVDHGVFTDIIDTQKYNGLFALPRDTISIQEHMIGVYTSTLIKDNSSIEIGIGKLSNSLANALIFRQTQNASYLELLNKLQVTEKFGSIIQATGECHIFNEGLYASTELMTDEYLHLYHAKILKKRVYDHIGLQKLLNQKKLTQIITAETLDILLSNNLIQDQLTADDYHFLQQFGVIKADVNYSDGQLILATGEKIPAVLSNNYTKQKIIENCLGNSLQTGKIIHAGFFIGSAGFYQALKNMSKQELQLISMTAIARTNSLSWNPELLTLQRQNARFINSTMMVTLAGVCISDGLKNMQEVSGVGGQFDFVTMAHQLPNARSIMNCRSFRMEKGKPCSNIMWDYPNQTIPRFLRDIIVTEYGIADCRSKTDSEVIKAMLNITDSRFQSELLDTAKKYGKVAQDYQIPVLFQHNYPDKLQTIKQQYHAAGIFSEYRFGSDFTDIENILIKSLLSLRSSSKYGLFWQIIKSLFFVKKSEKIDQCLKRMRFDKIKTFKEYMLKKLLIFVIAKNVAD